MTTDKAATPCSPEGAEIQKLIAERDALHLQLQGVAESLLIAQKTISMTESQLIAAGSMLNEVGSQRDAAEKRFVAARAENDELQQEVADLTNELVQLRQKLYGAKMVIEHPEDASGYSSIPNAWERFLLWLAK